MTEHEYFERLSALAAMGELSGEELAELDDHVNHCESCRTTAAELSQIVHTEPPSLHSDPPPWRDNLAQVFTRREREQRFLDRAKTKGYRFSAEIEKGAGVARLIPAPRALLVLVPSLLLVLAAVTIGTREFRESHFYAASADVPRQISDRSLEEARSNAKIAADTYTIAALESKVAEIRLALKLASDRIAATEQQRDKIGAENQQFRSGFDAEHANALALNARLQASEQRTAELNNSIQRLERNQKADAVVIGTQQKQLETLSAELNAQNEVLGQERQLLSAGRDVRDMMGARNLHIIDVFDADLSGKNRRAFGRVFYTEGKSLVFYAFDLTGGGTVANAKHSFQAWGLRDGAKESVKSLGIFYVDDAAQKRWVLKVENPEVLEQIDSVFVTVEPFGGATKPSTHKLLYAFLQNQPNHP